MTLGETGKTTYYVAVGQERFVNVKVYGDVHLILADDARFICWGGINVEKRNGASLSIYSESDGPNQGRLYANFDIKRRQAGIGPYGEEDGGDITIHGGYVNAAGSRAAGIGAAGFSIAKNKASQPGDIKIYGGTVIAQGGDDAAGIGGGRGYRASRAGVTLNSSGGNVTIYGGNVTATGGDNAPGIGDGANDVILYPDAWSSSAKSAVIRIHGGTVNAKGGKDAAGIGGGEDGNGGELYVYGGRVRAEGNGNGAGIGGGDRNYRGGDYYSDMERGAGANVYIHGGDVTAIAGAKCKARKPKSGSAIGCGMDLGDKDTPDRAHDLEIASNMKVTAGDAEDNIERTFTWSERVNACRWRNYAHIEPCRHENMGYSITDEYKHRSFCVNCKEVSSDQHDFGEPGSYHDCVCGKKFNMTTDVCVVTIHTSAHGWAYDTSDSQTMATSKSFVLPMPAEVDGLRFEGYMETDTEPTTIEMRDGETGLLPAGTLVQAQGGIKKYYARYRYVYTEEWAVSDDMKSATLTISNSIINHKETLNATCELLSDTPPTATENGERVYIISVTYQKTSYLTYNFSETLKKKYFYLPAIELDAQADNNEELLGQYDDSEGISSVTIRNLTLRKDGKLHPLCLPFDAVIEGTPLEGATIYELTGTELVGNQLQMNFKPITDDYILGGYPYFVKWASGTDIQNPTFNGVYVNDNPMTVSDTYYLIGGSFDPFAIADEDKGLVYVLSDGKLELAKDDLVAAFSNYLYIPRVSNEDGDLAVCSVRLSFEGDITVEKRVAFTWEGEGTAEKPYLIKNAGQLKDMSAYFNTSDPDVIGKYYRQVANIAFDKTVQNNFTPISSFNGHYDGGGYAISGLNIKRTGSDNAALMLAMAEGSTLKNVIIQNSSFQGSTAAPLAYQLMNAVSIENCHVLKDVTVTSDYHAAAGLVGNIGGLASVKSCTSQAMVTANQSLASGVVGMLTHGSLTDCIYLGSSLSAHASYKTYAVCNNNGGTVKDCYFTAPTLSDALAKLMPQYNKDVDNTGLLTALAARDKFLMETSGLTREQIGYDLTMNSCTTLSAVQNADGTWQSKAYSVCLPFYVSFKKQLGTDELSVLGSVEAYKAHQIDLTKKELIFTNVFPELAAGGAYIVVVKKGSVSLTGKNVTVVDSPAVPDKVMNAADDNQQIGEWKGTFKTIGNDEMIAQNVYIAQRNRTFRCQLKGKTGSWTNPFVGYFSPLEAQASDRFTVKFVYTEQGDDDEGEVTDFPSDEFDYDYDFGSETGIDAVETSNINRQTSDIYDLQGRQLTGQPQKGLYIQNGKKIVIK